MYLAYNVIKNCFLLVDPSDRKIGKEIVNGTVKEFPRVKIRSVISLDSDEKIKKNYDSYISEWVINHSYPNRENGIKDYDDFERRVLCLKI